VLSSRVKERIGGIDLFNFFEDAIEGSNNKKFFKKRKQYPFKNYKQRALFSRLVLVPRSVIDITLYQMTESLPLSWNASALAVGDGKSPDDVFLVELLLIFAKEVVEHCKCIIKCECGLQSTTTNEPFKAMRLQFHAIKGSASMLKLTRLTQISTKFENVLLCAIAESTTSSVISQLPLDDFFKEVMAVLQFIDIEMLDMTPPSGKKLNSILSTNIQEQIKSQSRSSNFLKVLQARLSTINK